MKIFKTTLILILLTTLTSCGVKRARTSPTKVQSSTLILEKEKVMYRLLVVEILA